MKRVYSIVLSALSVQAHLLAQTPALTVVSAASFQRDAAAPEMLASGFSTLIPQVQPQEAAAFSVTVRDSAGVERAASVSGVFPGQVNFLVPAGTATGQATVTLRRAGNVIAAGALQIAAVAPGLFTANSSGEGAPAGFAVIASPGGARRTEALFEWNDSLRSYQPRPFDLGQDEVYLELYGTGIRGFRNRPAVTLGGLEAPVAAAVAHASFPGLDQVNVGPLPRGLRGGRGLVDLSLTVDGVRANRLTLAPTMPASGAWGRRGELVEANSEMAVAELDGKIYVIGGYPASRVTVATVQVYDRVEDRWSLTTPLPAPMNHAMAAGVNGKLYLIGGQTTSAGAGNFSDQVFEYDPAAATWRTRAPMPTARGGGASAVVDGKIYVAGSRPPRGADFAVYDPREDKWTVLPDLPTQRNHLAAVAIGGKVYVVGGRFEGGFQSVQSDALEVYDPSTNTWTPRARMPKPRGGVNAVEALGCLHVFGGEFATGVHPDHDMYNPVTDTWTSLDRIPVPVHGVTGAAFLDGLIYLPGGGTEQGGSSGSRHHQVYRPNVACR